jgi:propionate CoA-transferase
MGLIRILLRLDLVGRIHLDAKRDLLFLDFSGLIVRRREDVDRIKEAVEAKLRPLGRRVAAVINYDHASISDEVVDAYAAMVQHMEHHWYNQVSRYASDAFELMRLGNSVLSRVPTQVYANSEEAVQHLRAIPSDTDQII